METSIRGKVTRIPISLIAYPLDKRSSMALLTDTATLCDNDRSAENRSALKRRRVDLLLHRMNKLGKKADSLARGIKEHARLGAKITEIVKGKLSLGTRILQLGGLEKIFKQLFSVTDGEKLLKASQCYLSTTAGPIAGLLFIFSEKIAFCSQKSIKFSSPDGELLRVRYKVVIPVSKIKRVDQSVNVMKPSQKYIEIVTVDDFDFWFMGFLHYKKSLKYLQQAVSQA